ncbi:MAG: arylsulfatase, partial [Bacteroidota bacterium]
TEHTGHLIDIVPTILEVTGAEYPDTYQGKKVLPYDGQSFLSVLMGNGTFERFDPLYFQWGKDEALIEEDWKLVRLDAGPWELYNRNQDKTELVDLSIVEPSVADSLIRKHEAWMRAMDAYR